jgi:hypothetical protein
MADDLKTAAAPPRKGCCRVASPARCCVLLSAGFCTLLLFCVSVAALALAARVYRPDVMVSSSASAPTGYYFGGAVSQGSGYWVTNKPAMPAARSDLGVVAVGNTSVYLLGGADGAGAPMATVWAFNAVGESYNTSLTPMPEPRYRFGVAAVGAVIYIMGGLLDPAADPTTDCRAYNTATDAWTACAPMALPRVDLSASSLNGLVYAVGGYGPGYAMAPYGSALEVFTPGANTWARLADMPTPRGDLVTAAFGGRIWALGGWNDSPAPLGSFQAAVEAYTPGRGWDTAANMLIGKGDLGVATYRGGLHAFGGEVWSGRTAPCPWDPATPCAINQVPTHDCASLLPDVAPASNAEYTGPGTAGSAAGNNGAPGVWTSLAPMPGARFRFSAASNAIAQAIFVFGGTKEDGSVLDTVSAFYDTVHPQAYVHYRDQSPLTLWSWF